MRLSENRPLAWGVLAVTILLCLALSGGGSLVALRGEAQAPFFATQGIDADLHARSDSARSLSALAVSLDVGTETAGRLSELSDALDETASIAEKYRINADLSETTEMLYTALDTAALSKENADYAYRLYKEVKSRNEIIGHSDYNERAEAFNRTLSAFPARFIGLLRGVTTLELYR